MSLLNPRLTKTNQFIKSSFKDLQDPVFLTFSVNFFPEIEQFPRFDGLYNNSLLMIPAGTTTDMFKTQGLNSSERFGAGAAGTNPNSRIEYSAYDWLHEYYGPNYAAELNRTQPHPGTALGRMIGGLAAIQDSPWYFQSVSGIADLWKQAQRVKEGNMKATLTFSCLESIRQPLTDIAENYRYAVYDNERLSYRLPENLRWFDMDIMLLEGRNLTDNKNVSGPFSAFKNIFRDDSLDLFVTGSLGQVISGIKVIKFKCKMCEFDFSEFLTGGGVTDFSVVIPDAPFKPSFKVNVGWVVQEEVVDEDVEDIRSSNILTGVFDALSNKLSSTLSNIASIPGDLIDATVNKYQTKLEGAVLGNIYTGKGFTAFNNKIDDLKSDATDFLTNRKSPVGPRSNYSIGSNALTPPAPTKEVKEGELDSAYIPAAPPKNTPEIDNVPGYVTQTVAQVSKIDLAYDPPPRQEEQTFGGAVYTENLEVEEVQDVGLTYEPPAPIPTQSGEIGDAYKDQLTVLPIAQIGNTYKIQPVVGPIRDIGDTYDDPASPAQTNDIGDTYPDEAGPAQIADIGDTYPDLPKPGEVGNLGDSYPDLPKPAGVGSMGDTYEDSGNADQVSSLGDAYPGEGSGQAVGALGDAYPDSNGDRAVSSIDDVYPDGPRIADVGTLGDAYPDEGGSESASNLGDVYP